MVVVNSVRARFEGFGNCEIFILHEGGCLFSGGDNPPTMLLVEISVGDRAERERKYLERDALQTPNSCGCFFTSPSPKGSTETRFDGKKRNETFRATLPCIRLVEFARKSFGVAKWRDDRLLKARTFHRLISRDYFSEISVKKEW